MAASCSGSSKKLDLGGQCVHNSDCNDPLSCQFATCHQQCVVSRDCPTGQQCVAGADGLGVCQTPTEAACGTGKQACSGALVCYANSTCVNACAATGKCPLTSQTCVSGTYCLGPELANIDAGAGGAGGGADAGVDGAAGIGGSTGPIGGSGGSDARVDVPITSSGGAIGSGGSTSSGGSTAGVDASVTSPRDAAAGNDGTAAGCLSPMTTFPRMAQGDSSPNWTSGVGAITANDLFIFYGWSGSNPGQVDGGAGKYGAIYVQSFDPHTSASRGPAHVLFNTPAGTFGSVPTVFGTATAPSGQIAILYLASIDCCTLGSLYAAFFDPSAAASAPTIVVLDSNPQSMLPYVIWSNARNAFAFTWSSHGGPGNIEKVANFSPEGLAVGGNTNVVTTSGVDNGVNESVTFTGGIAESGNILGVAYSDIKTYGPFLTILDRVGNPVGSTLQVGTYATAWNAIAGTPKGFVYFYASSSLDSYDLKEVFLPTSGGVVNATPDAGSFTWTSVNPGGGRPTGGVACMDNVGPNATGGAGIVAYYSGGPVFAYVNPDGTQPQSPNQVVAHSMGTYDKLSVASFNGRFLVSLTSSVAMSTQIFANGCP